MNDPAPRWVFGRLDQFLSDIPYFLRRPLPPLQELNKLLLKGQPNHIFPDGLPDGCVQVDAGMSGGCAWKPFAISADEYAELIAELHTCTSPKLNPVSLGHRHESLPRAHQLLDPLESRLASRVIAIGGAWIAEREWRGFVSSDESVVALLFREQDQQLEWIKSELPRDLRDPEIRLLLLPYDEAGRDIQLNVTVLGGQLISRVMLTAPLASAIAVYPSTGQTGTLMRLVSAHVDPTLEIGVLFVASSDIEVVRNHLWRVREAAIVGVPEDLKGPLTRGRKGKL